MKDYSRWMTSGEESEDLIYQMAEKSQVTVNDEVSLYESIINDANEWQKEADIIWLIKKNLYSPVRGDYITYNNQQYLSVFVPEDRDFFWSSKMRLCNSKFPLPGQQVCTTYTNDFGEEVEDCTDSAPVDIPCIVETSFYKQGQDQPINLSADIVRITIPYTEHDSLKVNYAFKLYGDSYQISSFDYTQSLDKIGLLIINAKRV